MVNGEMVNVEIFYDNGAVKGFRIKGHAGVRCAGENLVCASISAISQTALLGLGAFLTVEPDWKIEKDGYLECWLPDNLLRKDIMRARVILGTMVLGLKGIEESYGQYLKVSKRRWTKCCSK